MPTPILPSINIEELFKHKARMKDVSVIGLQNSKKALEKLMELVDDKDPRAVIFVASKILQDSPRGVKFPHPLPPLNSLKNIELAMDTVWEYYSQGQVTSGQAEDAYSLIERRYKIMSDKSTNAMISIVEAFKNGRPLDEIKTLLLSNELSNEKNITVISQEEKIEEPDES